MAADSYDDFFRAAYGSGSVDAYDYQRRLAHDPWPDFLNVPTGLGKTAAVVLGWLWKRGWRADGGRVSPDPETPRRLVFCLPMRVLVEQTEENARMWTERLRIFGVPGAGKVSVHVLMGGSDDVRQPLWAEHPEEDMILIGTQDMLLSRALMRGYGMSRYQWPVHFSLLHNDCLWAFDEVQLMGAGLATSCQIEAFRRSFPLAKSSRSLWLSATLNRDWFATVDLKSHLPAFASLGIGDRDRQQAGDRLAAAKSLARAGVALTKVANTKGGRDAYLDDLANFVLDHHDADAQTLVIVNRVDRAQRLFHRLRSRRSGRQDLLIHARFRAAERAEQTRRLREESWRDRIIVATQAIEAGVDVSSRVLITELAPWSSMVQRFGRCNRYGENNGTGAQVYWVDIEDDADAKPYTAEALASARTKLQGLGSASARDLPDTDDARPLTPVLRRKDFLDLFNTDPDLSGFDVDVSDFIRDSDSPGIQVFWRNFDENPNEPVVQPGPARDELCPVSMGQAGDLHIRGAWYWDTLGTGRRSGLWVRLDRRPRPGMTLLLRAADGGYDPTVGFDPELKKLPVPTLQPPGNGDDETFSEDWRSHQGKPVFLVKHLPRAARHADRLCLAVGETKDRSSVVRASRWHDVGKAHPVFDETMHACSAAPEGFLAKSPCKASHSRRFFRHELASMLAWLAQHEGEPDADLVAYLILSHHGKVRMSLRAMPTETAEKGVKRFARGVWEGDTLPALGFDGEHSDEIRLKLALMEIGLGEQGASWMERSLRLLNEHGPFRLAWLETLVRLADWRASREEQLASEEVEDNRAHELDHGHPELAKALARGAAADSTQSSAAQGGAQHGVRGGAGGPADAQGGTRPPHAATRHLDTTLGILSYADLAPHLARRVEALQHAIAEGELDDRDVSEDLFLELHRRICGDLTPDFAGRWRTCDVVVGSHEPPSAPQVAQHMREYARDLAARLSHLPPNPDELWLETLAFAEGRLLSIHPFADFNGRVTRVFIDWLTRRLDLPDVDPTPDEGEATERYLAALRAADRRHWQPLMEIWRERFEKGPQA